MCDRQGRYTKATGIRSYSESNPAALFWVCFFILLQTASSLFCMRMQRFESRIQLFYVIGSDNKHCVITRKCSL